MSLGPRRISRRLLVQGESWLPTFTLCEADGSTIDLSAAGRSVKLMLGDSVVKRSGVSGESTYPDGTGADGRIMFLFSQADTLAIDVGFYDVYVVYEDTSVTPNVKRVEGRGTVEFEAPAVGAI